MSEKRTILITGGYGFIGSHVVRHFVKKYPDYLIINLDSLTYAGNINNLSDVNREKNYEAVMLDIAKDKDKIAKAFDKFNVTDVIHLAAESHVDRSMLNPTVFAETNIMGTLNLLNIAREYWKGDYSKHVFLNMGTDEIFGALGVDDEPFNEKTPLDPHSPYSTSKTAAVMFGKTYFEAYGLPVINLACGNAIGPNQFPEKLVPLVIDRLINGGNIPVYGEGKQMRDWTNVHDIADAIDLLVHKGTPGELYCIGGDACKQNIEIIERLILEVAKYYTEDKVSDFRKQITFIKDPRGKSHDFRYDINHDKITNELGWVPNHTFEQSIEETVKWYFENQEWVKKVKSGEYKAWLREYYGG
jgi:dTDP-glucose 4,6-dehydratase